MQAQEFPIKTPHFLQNKDFPWLSFDFYYRRLFSAKQNQNKILLSPIFPCHSVYFIPSTLLCNAFLKRDFTVSYSTFHCNSVCLQLLKYQDFL